MKYWQFHIFTCGLFTVNLDGVLSGSVSVRIDPVTAGNKISVSYEHLVTTSVDSFLNSRNWIWSRLQLPNFSGQSKRATI